MRGDTHTPSKPALMSFLPASRHTPVALRNALNELHVVHQSRNVRSASTPKWSEGKVLPGLTSRMW
jgi:hypothetical protein